MVMENYSLKESVEFACTQLHTEISLNDGIASY